MRRNRCGLAALAGAIRAGDINLLAGGIDAPKSTATASPLQAAGWFVPSWLPAGIVTMLHPADESEGRILALQLAMCFAAGRKFLGRNLPREEKRCLFLSSVASPYDLKHASAAIERELAIDPSDLTGLFFVLRDGSDFSLAMPDAVTGGLKPTPTYDALHELVVDQRPTLIVLDALPDLFGGDHYDQRHTDAFMVLMERLCSIGGATMLLLAPADFGAPRR